MATYTNVISWFKPLSRSESFPIDASSIQESLSAAQSYTSNPIAYAGQVLSVLNTDTNKYELYVLQPGDDGYTLEKPGVDAANLKQYVMVVDSLPASNQVEGVLYINKADSTGSIWTTGAWKQVFADVSEDVADFESRIGTLETDIDLKAPINNPVFTGTVTLAADPADNLQAATKQYVDRLVAGIVDCTPGIADLTDNTLPTTGYKAGQTWRVAEDGTYAGQECEIGDLIICIKDYAEGGSAGNADFMIIQANIDGAVTSSADATTDGDIVVYDGITGKVIKSSAVNISSLNDAIAKAHEHTNKTQLDSFTMDQTALLAQAKTEAQSLVDALSEIVDDKADKGTTLAEYGITDAYTKGETDGKISSAVAAAGHLTKVVLEAEEELPEPTEAQDNAIYLKPVDSGSGNQYFEEFIVINDQWEKIGDTAVDLSNYATQSWVTSQIQPVSTKADANAAAITVINGSGEGSITKAKTDAVTEAKSYADGLASNYATAAQGALADTALQKADITTGATNGTIAVEGTDVAGLKSAAYAETTAFDAAGAAAAVEAKLGDLGESSTVVEYVSSKLVWGVF